MHVLKAIISIACIAMCWAFWATFICKCMYNRLQTGLGHLYNTPVDHMQIHFYLHTFLYTCMDVYKSGLHLVIVLSKGESNPLKIKQVRMQGDSRGFGHTPFFNWNKEIIVFTLLSNEAKHFHCVTQNLKYICERSWFAKIFLYVYYLSSIYTKN